MLIFKVKGTKICVCVFRHENRYVVTSCDSKGHEELLAEGLTTLKELEDLLANVFDNKITCYGTFKNAKQVARILNLD